MSHAGPVFASSGSANSTATELMQLLAVSTAVPPPSLALARSLRSVHQPVPIERAVSRRDLCRRGYECYRFQFHVQFCHPGRRRCIHHQLWLTRGMGCYFSSGGGMRSGSQAGVAAAHSSALPLCVRRNVAASPVRVRRNVVDPSMHNLAIIRLLLV